MISTNGGKEPKRGRKIEVKEIGDEKKQETTDSPKQEVPTDNVEKTPVEAAENATDEKPPTTEELTNHLQRLAAEFENFKKRTSRQHGEAKLAGMSRVMQELLPVLDSFDRSLETEGGVDHVEAWREGFTKIHRQLMDALSGLGLVAIKPQKGELLDPNQHEVMMAQPSSEVDANHIVDTFVVGYKLDDRLLRPAKVIVAVDNQPEDGEQQERES